MTTALAAARTPDVCAIMISVEIGNSRVLIVITGTYFVLLLHAASASTRNSPALLDLVTVTEVEAQLHVLQLRLVRLQVCGCCSDLLFTPYRNFPFSR